MAAYCTMCARPFPHEKALEQHLIYSASHKTYQNGKASKLTRRAGGSGYSTESASNAPQAISSLPREVELSRPLDQRTLNGTWPGQHDNRWSIVPISEQETRYEELHKHCHSLKDLRRSGFTVQAHSPTSTSGSRKCTKCHEQATRLQTITGCCFHPGRKKEMKNQQQRYDCCDLSGAGCKSSPNHDYGQPTQRLLARRGDFELTPSLYGAPKRRAVALDCEMGEARDATSEVILLCAVDYLTGESLIHRYVSPTKDLIDWRTCIHGVTEYKVTAATERNEALHGWKGARQELWRHIDENTILIGQALQHDLKALRMVHHRIVDSAILSKNAVGRKGRQWGLAALCSQLLGVEIRKNIGEVHDCLEDTLAAREVVLWCTREAQKLRDWGNEKRKEQNERKASRKAKRTRKVKGTRETGSSAGHIIVSSDDDEMLCWSDIAEDLGYPPGYDPWSD
ncbi:uncharacterized protein K452DRAFT_338079 [Aplosporella prunicola CBS 121167]|uniref:Exonuclease domain-containing protein n=1 Tax=Aplosporella prunicola CBS 121167 TaxID=1176127 RepID=A0A6A6AU48_9PEZI|nr:uncharacterized protein K452DRAFT_338079 [Aplosporella prunicola CBS 121167]KAF2135116.1 hypothetical protein K452DRAFT_338079 [Aplosporella prunicola CBS 121167]